MNYVLNSAVMTGFGRYFYEKCSPQEAREFLESGPFASAVGYEETAQALWSLTGVHVPTNRRAVYLQPGDKALVFRLVMPQGERIAPGEKGNLSRMIEEGHYELGIIHYAG